MDDIVELLVGETDIDYDTHLGSSFGDLHPCSAPGGGVAGCEVRHPGWLGVSHILQQAVEDGARLCLRSQARTGNHPDSGGA
jgi:hypothetical protein